MLAGRPRQYDEPDRKSQAVPAVEVLKKVPPYPTDAGPLGFNGEKQWDYICSALIAAGVLAVPFLAMVETTCRIYAELCDLRKQVRKMLDKDPNANFLKTATSGKPHPLASMVDKKEEIYAKHLNYLGLSPAARRAANIPLSSGESNAGHQHESEGARIAGGDDEDEDLAA